jgi:glycolate oxidase FAD binding subunit
MDMSIHDAEREVARLVGAADVVVPTGSGTHREVGGPTPVGTHVRAPGGVVAYDPAELTVTVGAGTTVGELARVLAAEGQECPLDPRDAAATVGGTLACGLSGVRRLRYGPLRDRVLEVRFATAAGTLVRGGGPTVKNVTGFDLPRLLVGSLGTIGVLTRVILRCQPAPMDARWGSTEASPEDVSARCFRPSALLWDGTRTSVLLEGHPDDVARQASLLGLEARPVAPPMPEGPHRGRISVPPAAVLDVGRELDGLAEVRWLAEAGVGTVHVAAATEAALAAARAVATRLGGWLLREAGAEGLDGFGTVLPNAALMSRVKDAFDPQGKLAPGRLPFAPAELVATT